MLEKFIINGLINGLLYSLLAIGFGLVYNTTRIFHIAVAGIYVFAAYMFWWLSAKLGLPTIPAAAVAILLSMGLSLLSEVCLYRPLRRNGTSSNVIMIASIGLMTVIVNSIAMIFGNDTKSVADSAFKTYRLGEITLSTPKIVQVIVAVVSITVFLILLSVTPFGKKVRALGADETLFESLGYDKQRTFSAVFLVSGLFIGMASCATVYDVNMKPEMGMAALVNAMVAMIIGGSGRFGASVAGGLFLGFLQSLVLYRFENNWQITISFALLLVFLFLRPQGIAGYKQRMF